MNEGRFEITLESDESSIYAEIGSLIKDLQEAEARKQRKPLHSDVEFAAESK